MEWVIGLTPSALKRQRMLPWLAFRASSLQLMQLSFGALAVQTQGRFFGIALSVES